MCHYRKTVEQLQGEKAILESRAEHAEAELAAFSRKYHNAREINKEMTRLENRIRELDAQRPSDGYAEYLLKLESMVDKLKAELYHYETEEEIQELLR